jgi:hypothetical protein
MSYRDFPEPFLDVEWRVFVGGKQRERETNDRRNHEQSSH